MEVMNQPTELGGHDLAITINYWIPKSPFFRLVNYYDLPRLKLWFPIFAIVVSYISYIPHL